MSQATVVSQPNEVVPAKAHGLMAFLCASALFGVVHFMGPMVAVGSSAETDEERELEAIPEHHGRVESTGRGSKGKSRAGEDAGCGDAADCAMRSAPAKGRVQRAATTTETGDSSRPVRSSQASSEVLARSGDLQSQLDMFRQLVEANKEKQAFHWLYRAAMQRHGDSMLEIARWYESGRAVHRNELEAFAWYANAEASGVSGGAASAHYLYTRMKPARQRMAGFRKAKLAELLDEAAAKRAGGAGVDDVVDQPVEE